MNKRKHYPLDIKRAVVREFERGGKSLKEVAEKYAVNANCLGRWRHDWLCQTKSKAAAPRPKVAKRTPTEAAAAPLQASATRERALQDRNYEGASALAAALARAQLLEATLRVWQDAYRDLLAHVRQLTSVTLPPPPDADASIP